MGVDNRPGSFYNSNAPSWANTGNTQVDEEEQGGGGGNAVTSQVTPDTGPWGSHSPSTMRSIHGSHSPSTMRSTHSSTGMDDNGYEDNPTPEPTPTQPTGGSGSPWMMFGGVGQPAFGQNMLYSNPLYDNPVQPVDWRQQGGGVDNARMNNNNPMPQVTKWNAPPVPDVTMIPNKPITPQEVAAITPQVKSYSKENPLGLGAGPDTQINAATNIADNQAKLIAGLQELYRVPSQPKGVDTKIIKSPLLPKKLNAFGGGGGGGGGGRGPNWKAALDTMNWNI